MSLPHIIEYLLSRPRGDSFLLTQSASQTIIPAVPAGMQFTLAEVPGQNAYAYLPYKSQLHPNMVPDAFYGVIQYSGNEVIAGIGTTHWIQDALESFVAMTPKQPAVLTIRNRTNIPQFYGGTLYFVVIRTENDYREVLLELNRIGSSAMESLAREANGMLATLTQRLGVPRPPVSGGS